MMKDDDFNLLRGFGYRETKGRTFVIVVAFATDKNEFYLNILQPESKILYLKRSAIARI